jgi:hypothetical protein
MRRFLVLQGCLALLFALFLAPYEHVHSGQCNGRESNGVFDNSTVVHAHPFLFSHVHADVFSLRHGKKGDAARVEESSDEHAAWWLNSSSLILHGAILLFVAQHSTALSAPAASSFTTAETVEERGHDPPPLDCSVPRAPPA